MIWRDEPVACLGAELCMKSQTDGLGLKAGADDGRWLKNNHHNQEVYCSKKVPTGYTRDMVNLQEMTGSRAREEESCSPVQAVENEPPRVCSGVLQIKTPPLPPRLQSRRSVKLLPPLPCPAGHTQPLHTARMPYLLIWVILMCLFNTLLKALFST